MSVPAPTTTALTAAATPVTVAPVTAAAGGHRVDPARRLGVVAW